MSKKQEIISAAREVIYSKGYQSTSINDILLAAHIGKGQFYHYFTSKYDLGIAVVEDLIKEWDQELIKEIFQSPLDPITKLNRMLERTLVFHTEMENKSGCPIGNLAIEMSEHDETFRIRLQYIFNRWISSLEDTLQEMVNKGYLSPNIDTKKSAQAIVAMIEGGVLLMKNQKDIHFLTNILDVIRLQYNFSE
ncbi:TetR/AcrR family transcriptional regulator [Priestia endophytica]|jgi:TetR/AcrR family transcriptional regulator, transcriptional repressor for nem operon|uniref:TetR/AcrR family transcriptional regulator n=1 Tax=Priestia endophytica TaxID=135735 RepID=UPI000F53074A|nr:TetR/AcrR family transcriptional regulator [Priestia endophytica]RPJ97827.1 hypothetical protein FH5_04092 [Priestia endophytica]